MLLFARDLRATGELRDDLTDEEVAHLVWMTNSPEFYQLATSGGRSPTDYARQALDLWTRTLIADPGQPALDVQSRGARCTPARAGLTHLGWRHGHRDP